MTIQKIEIDTAEIPDGWEVVAYRKPIPGETVFHSGQTWGTNRSTWNFPVLVVRKKWQPPEWLLLSKCKSVKRVKGEWVAITDTGYVLWIGMYGLPFDPPCGPEVPDDQTERTW